VITLRKRHGQGDRKLDSKRPDDPCRKAQAESADEPGPEKRHISWVTAITIGTQLALDIIRVVREATDLKRKLFPAKDDFVGQVSSKESG
jgi:hypothetical protein